MELYIHVGLFMQFCGEASATFPTNSDFVRCRGLLK